MKGTLLEGVPPPTSRGNTTQGESEYSNLYEKLLTLKNPGDYAALKIDIPAGKKTVDVRNACESSVKGWFLRQKKENKFTGIRRLISRSKVEADSVTVWFILEA